MAQASPLSHQGELFAAPTSRERFKNPITNRRGRGDGSPPLTFGEQLSLGLGPARSNGHTVVLRESPRPSIAAISLRRVRPYLPTGAEPFVIRLLREVPTEVVPVESRESKHGDFTKEAGTPYGRITVNVCGNSYRFLLTLLHELAHARVAARYRRRMRPHGPQWKDEFARLLFRLSRQHFLPGRLSRAVHRHALDPKSTDEYDTELQLELRRYDTTDQRLMVTELDVGTKFSLDGYTVLRRGELIRRRIRCTGPKGQIYSVLPVARVETVYDRT